MISGLQGRPELNGLRGLVKSWDAQRSRVRVQLPNSSESVALKPENVKSVMCVSSGKKPQWADRDADIIARACDVARNTVDPCGDGDQSALHIAPGTPGNALEQMWARGGDFNPWQPYCAEVVQGREVRVLDEGGMPERARMLYSRFFIACAWGSLELVRTLIAKTAGRPDGRTRLLELRESNLRYAPLHACIAGARVQPGSAMWRLPPGTPPPEFEEVARTLTRTLILTLTLTLT